MFDRFVAQLDGGSGINLGANACGGVELDEGESEIVALVVVTPCVVHSDRHKAIV